jgi:predicted O-methyltransferase YrrM
MSLAGRLPAESRLLGPANRALMLAAAARLARRRERGATALRRALIATALGRATAAERDSIARVDERRRRVASRDASHYRDAAARDGDRRQDAAAGYLSEWSEPWSIPRLWGEFLLRLVRRLAPASFLELGTGYGTSGLYVGEALRLNGRGALTTVDRERRLRPVAEEGFRELGLAALVTMISAEIDESLGGELAEAAPIECALIDAEHTEPATVAHFELLLPFLAAGAIVLVDDVHLSEEMNRAWRRIAAYQQIAAAVDLHRLGAALLR